MKRHLIALLAPEELLEFGRSDQMSPAQLQIDRDAVRPFAEVVWMMVGEDYFTAYMTALTAIERTLRVKASLKS